MTFNELLKAFGEKLGGSVELAPDESGAVWLDVGGMPLTFIGLEDVGQVVLSGEIGEPPPEDRMERLYRALLRANHNFAATDGATISIDPADDKVTLCKALPLALTDGASFFAEVERFVNTLETWRRIVGDFHGMEIDGTDAPKAEAAAGDDGLVPGRDGLEQMFVP